MNSKTIRKNVDHKRVRQVFIEAILKITFDKVKGHLLGLTVSNIKESGRRVKSKVMVYGDLPKVITTKVHGRTVSNKVKVSTFMSVVQSIQDISRNV